jgi:hypothetical protein
MRRPRPRGDRTPGGGGKDLQQVAPTNLLTERGCLANHLAGVVAHRPDGGVPILNRRPVALMRSPL